MCEFFFPKDNSDTRAFYCGILPKSQTIVLTPHFRDVTWCCILRDKNKHVEVCSWNRALLKYRIHVHSSDRSDISDIHYSSKSSKGSGCHDMRDGNDKSYSGDSRDSCDSIDKITAVTENTVVKVVRLAVLTVVSVITVLILATVVTEGILMTVVTSVRVVTSSSDHSDIRDSSVTVTVTVCLSMGQE